MLCFSLTKNARTALKKNGGMGLIEALFGIAMLSLVFWGIFGAFKLSLEIVMSTKAKTGALSLASEQIEFLRSLSYEDVATIGGIPAGDIVQLETIELNETTYTRRTFVQYVDAPQDGQGVDDENGVTADYKVAKVEVTWMIRESPRSYSLVTSIVPKGMESVGGGGTVTVTVLDAYGAPLSGAQVRIENSEVSPAIDVATFSNAQGRVAFPGTPAGSGYQITVSKSGYSTAGTYSSTALNPDPNPPHLSVALDQTTGATFAIDRVSSLAVSTLLPPAPDVFSDTFGDASQVAVFENTALDSGTVILVGATEYAPQGFVTSDTVSPQNIEAWDELVFDESTPPGTDIYYRLYQGDGQGGFTLIPEEMLVGNAAGFTESPVDVSTIPRTVSEIRLQAELVSSDTTMTPVLAAWELSYQEGSVPVPNVAFALVGSKVIGSDGGSLPIYKYDEAHTTDGAGDVTIAGLEWDTYQLSVDGASGWDIAQACPPVPISLAPNVASTTQLYLASDSDHSLRVTVVDAAGTTISGAAVSVTSAGYDETIESGECGQAFFSDMEPSGDTYSIEVTAPGYAAVTVPDVSIVGDATYTVIID